MKENRIQAYLRKLERHLWLRGLADQNDLAEIENHLLEAVERRIRSGIEPGASRNTGTPAIWIRQNSGINV